MDQTPKLEDFTIPVIVWGQHPKSKGSNYLLGFACFETDRICWVKYDSSDCTEVNGLYQEEKYELKSNIWRNKNYPELKFDIRTNINIPVVEFNGQYIYLIMEDGGYALLVEPPVVKGSHFALFFAEKDETDNLYKKVSKETIEDFNGNLLMTFNSYGLFYISERLRLLSEIYSYKSMVPENMEMCHYIPIEQLKSKKKK